MLCTHCFIYSIIRCRHTMSCFISQNRKRKVATISWPWHHIWTSSDQTKNSRIIHSTFMNNYLMIERIQFLYLLSYLSKQIAFVNDEINEKIFFQKLQSTSPEQLGSTFCRWKSNVKQYWCLSWWSMKSIQLDISVLRLSFPLIIN